MLVGTNRLVAIKMGAVLIRELPGYYHTSLTKVSPVFEPVLSLLQIIIFFHSRLDSLLSEPQYSENHSHPSAISSI